MRCYLYDTANRCDAWDEGKILKVIGEVVSCKKMETTVPAASQDTKIFCEF